MVNWINLPPGAEGLEHDESETGQEDAGPEGMRLLAVGARRGSYEPRGPS